MKPVIKKNRQHHVWSHYLKGWSSNGTLHCKINSKISPFSNTSDNLAVENHFYRIEKLSPLDVELLINFLRSFDPPIRKQIGKIIKPILNWQSNPTDEYKTEIDTYKNNAIEDYHANIEGSFIPLLDELRAGKLGFLREINSSIKFYNFIAHQALRTKKLKGAAIENMRASHPDYPFDNIWGLMMIATSMNFGANLFLERSKRNVELIEAADNQKFITGDQPVINIANLFDLTGGHSEAVCIFYPISPDRALLLSDRNIQHGLGGQINRTEMHLLNTEMRRAARFQTFATSPSELI